MAVKGSIKTGVLAGFFGSMCCTVPVLLIAIGIGSIGFALGFAKYRPFFMILGVTFLVFALYRKIKREEGCCTVGTIKKNLSMIITAVITAIIIWTVLIYVVAPWLARTIYG